MELHLDKDYIRLIEKVKIKLDLALQKGLIGEDEYGRTFNTFITQPDKAFEEVTRKYLNDPIKTFIKKFKTREGTLLNKNQPIIGTEGHHIFHQNTVKRLRKLPIQAQLEVMHKFRNLGGTSGIVDANITYFGRMAHRANLFKDAILEVTGHINPFNLKTDTGYWSDDYDFNLAEMSTDEIADSLHNEAYGPQAMLAKNARMRKSEIKARRWFKQLLGGTNVFDPKMPPVIKNKYKALIKSLGFNFNDIAEAFERGETPEFPNKGKLIPLVEALNLDPNIISQGKIEKIGAGGKILRSLRDLGITITTNAPKTLAGTIGVEDAANPILWQNVAEAEIRIKAGENPLTVLKEEGIDVAKDFKDQLLTTAGALTFLTGLSKFAPGATVAAGTGLSYAAPPLLAVGAWKSIDAYREAKGLRTLTEITRDDVAPVFNAAKEGDALTSISGDNTLGSSLQQNQIGSRGLVKYRTQESTEWTTDLDEDEEPKPEYKYAPTLTLRGVK